MLTLKPILLSWDFNFSYFMNWNDRKICGIVYNGTFFLPHYISSFLKSFKFRITFCINKPDRLIILVNDVYARKNWISIADGYPGKFASALQERIYNLFTHGSKVK